MKSLVVVLDESAPSFCYYETRQSPSANTMKRDVFEQVVAFADGHGLSLQLVVGQRGLPEFAQEILGERPYTCIFPLQAAADAQPEDVVVVHAREDIDASALGNNAVVVLRAAPNDLEGLADLWERLSARVRRIVLVMVGLDQIGIAALERYKATLLEIRKRLATKYLGGQSPELSVLSDRLALTAPAECGAGIDHLTATPNGDLHLCPGFAADGEPSVGNLRDGWCIENAEILTRSRAPICGVCDAYQCRRCIYINRRATLELNTPPWQICRAAHIEREASRFMLAELHEAHCLTKLSRISPLEYDDPLDRVIAERHGIPVEKVVAPKALDAYLDERRHKDWPLPKLVSTESDRLVGRVAPQERDTIRDIFRRKTSLGHVVAALSNLPEQAQLHARAVNDMAQAITEFQQWWNTMARNYAWRSERACQQWRIDFETCEIFLEG